MLAEARLKYILILPCHDENQTYFFYPICIPVKSPVFNRSLLFFYFILPASCFSPVFFLSPVFLLFFLENQSKATNLLFFLKFSPDLLKLIQLSMQLSSSSLPNQYSVDLIEPTNVGQISCVLDCSLLVNHER